MLATILKSTTRFGDRFIALVPNLDGTSKTVYQRVGNSKGVPWKEVAVDTINLSDTVDVAAVVQVSYNDAQAIDAGQKPTVLLQKLQRDVLVATATPWETVAEAFSEQAVHIATPVIATPVAPVIIPEAVEPEVVAPIAPAVEAVVITEEKAEPMSVTTLSSSMETPLSVPDVETYIERTFYGETERSIYDYARSTGQNVLATGPAGTGKTSSAKNYAATNNLPFITIECTQQIDQSITQGRFVPTGNGNETVWKYSQLATAIQQPSVILINELTRMTPKAASLFLRLLQERELLIEPLNQVIKVHPDVLFIADQNTGSGYTGTSKQDAALVDRFNIKLEFTYDPEIESKFIDSPTLLNFATAIRTASEQSDQFSVPMSTRILKNFVAQARGLNFGFAVNSLLANYPNGDGERDALKMRFDANKDTIAEELGVDAKSYKK